MKNKVERLTLEQITEEVMKEGYPEVVSRVKFKEFFDWFDNIIEKDYKNMQVGEAEECPLLYYRMGRFGEIWDKPKLMKELVKKFIIQKSLEVLKNAGKAS